MCGLRRVLFSAWEIAPQTLQWRNKARVETVRFPGQYKSGKWGNCQQIATPEVPYIHAADEIPDAALVFVNKTLLRLDTWRRQCWLATQYWQYWCIISSTWIVAAQHAQLNHDAFSFLDDSDFQCGSVQHDILCPGQPGAWRLKVDQLIHSTQFWGSWME